MKLKMGEFKRIIQEEVELFKETHLGFDDVDTDNDEMIDQGEYDEYQQEEGEEEVHILDKLKGFLETWDETEHPYYKDIENLVAETENMGDGSESEEYSDDDENFDFEDDLDDEF